MNKLGNDLVKSLEEALAHAGGKRIRARTHKVALEPKRGTSMSKRGKRQRLRGFSPPSPGKCENH